MAALAAFGLQEPLFKTKLIISTLCPRLFFKTDIKEYIRIKEHALCKKLRVSYLELLPFFFKVLVQLQRVSIT